MWKSRRPTETKTEAEGIIDRRDKSIKALVDELISGTEELKSLYLGDKSGKPQPNV